MSRDLEAGLSRSAHSDMTDTSATHQEVPTIRQLRREHDSQATG
ncbi:hypothetical protein ACFY9X_00935 [Streptomyces nigra]